MLHFLDLKLDFELKGHNFEIYTRPKKPGKFNCRFFSHTRDPLQGSSFLCVFLSNNSQTFIFSTAGESLYLILGVDKEASPDEIKKAYRKVCCTFLLNHYCTGNNTQYCVLPSC